MKKYITEYYKSYNDIHVIISPTEEGWSSIKLNRNVIPRITTLVITSKNSSPYKKDIILSTRDGHQWNDK